MHSTAPFSILKIHALPPECPSRVVSTWTRAPFPSFPSNAHMEIVTYQAVDLDVLERARVLHIRAAAVGRGLAAVPPLLPIHVCRELGVRGVCVCVCLSSRRKGFGREREREMWLCVCVCLSLPLSLCAHTHTHTHACTDSRVHDHRKYRTVRNDFCTKCTG